MNKKKTKEVELNLTDEQFIYLALAAHDKNITLNSYVNKMLSKYVRTLEKSRS